MIRLAECYARIVFSSYTKADNSVVVATDSSVYHKITLTCIRL